MLKIDLRFFAGDDKTEAPTPKRIKKAREEGQVAKSAELNASISLIVSFVALRTFAPSLIRQIRALSYASFELISDRDDIFTTAYMAKYVSYMFAKVIVIVVPIALTITAVGLLANFAQVGWSPSGKLLAPKFGRLNPLSGIKRLFSPRAFTELLKSVAKLAIIGFSVYNALMEQKNAIFRLTDMDTLEAAALIGATVLDMGVSVGTTYLAIGVLDFAYQKLKHSRELRMTKQEIKDEFKEAEGDPNVKGMIKQRMREVSMRRMIADVKTADAVIANPTHYAVAIRYAALKDAAPVVVAKGADLVAQRIKDAARESGVQIVEDKELARALYFSCDVGKLIPPELYESVAEILAYIYRLKNVSLT
jgi:flagellar biosynthetic protein FlhB